MKFARFLLGLIFLMGYASAYSSEPSVRSFIISCEDETNEYHLAPLAFFEFKDDLDISESPTDITLNFKRASATFSDLDQKLRSYQVIESNFQSSTYGYDPLFAVPKGCEVKIGVLTDPHRNAIEVDKEDWPELSPEVRNYLLLEVTVGPFLKRDYAPIDLRRFTSYVHFGMFNQFDVKTKAQFLKYHGVK